MTRFYQDYPVFIVFSHLQPLSLVFTCFHLFSPVSLVFIGIGDTIRTFSVSRMRNFNHVYCLLCTAHCPALHWNCLPFTTPQCKLQLITLTASPQWITAGYKGSQQPSWPSWAQHHTESSHHGHNLPWFLAQYPNYQPSLICLVKLLLFTSDQKIKITWVFHVWFFPYAWVLWRNFSCLDTTMFVSVLWQQEGCMVRYSLSPREIQLPVGRIFSVFPSRAGLILKSLYWATCVSSTHSQNVSLS